MNAQEPRLVTGDVVDGPTGQPLHVVGPDSELARYLADVETFLTRYIAFPGEHEPVAVALWVAHAHLVERADVSPILAVTSAEMRSGKTRCLDCLELLVPEPFRAVIPSEAVTYTILAKRPRRTLLLDEADAIFGPRTTDRYEGLRAILNSGNRAGTPVSRVRFLKVDGVNVRDVEELDVYGPKAIAGIGKLPDTVADRAIPIRMRRRAPDEPVARFRQRVATLEAGKIIEPDWSAVTLADDVPVPDALNDRAADGWEPLLAIAEAAGDDWLQRATLAAVALSSAEDDQVSVGIRLLGDIREVFGEADHLPTAELLQRLHDLDEAPWGDWYGKPLTARGLAKLLGPYHIGPQQRRMDGAHRGYFRVDLADAWTRYLPAPGTSGTRGTPRTAERADEPAVPDAWSDPVPDVPDVPLSRRSHPEQVLLALDDYPASASDPDDEAA